MKKQLYISLLIAATLTSSCSDNKESGEENSINLAKAMDELTELKVSDFGKTVRYVPLETIDESLIGNNPNFKVTKDKIFVTARNQCLAFDKNSGKFIAKIGHIGDDPEGYSSSECWIDEENEMLYFLRRPNQLMKYDTYGNYKGKIEMQGKNMPSYFVFKGPSIIGAYNNDMNYSDKSLAVFNRSGEMMDSIPPLLPSTGLAMNDIQSISVIRDINQYGNWSKGGIVSVNYSDDKQLKTSPGTEVLWMSDNEVRFKEIFSDTIYALKDNALEPYITFNTGNWHWPASERTNPDNNTRRLLITWVNETENIIFFQCIQGLYDDMATLYNGLYDKTSGTTKLAKQSNEIKDDITSFLPVQIVTISSTDEYAGLIEVPDALEWLEDNPGAADSNELSFLNGLTEDMNPVVVLIK